MAFRIVFASFFFCTFACFGMQKDLVLNNWVFYKDYCSARTENETVVWPRVLSGKDEDASALFVGYANRITMYGDEGVSIRADTPKCSKTVFFTGGSDNLFEKVTWRGTADYDLVDQNVYNHLYGDFRLLETQFPYLVNSSFFDYIFVGKDTLPYFSSSSIIVNFCSMLKGGGSMFIAARKEHWYNGPKFYEFIDGASYSLSAYFYHTEVAYAHFVFDNLYYSDYIGFVSGSNRSFMQKNQVSALKEQISPKIPFATEFFDQNEPAIILSVTKKTV